MKTEYSLGQNPHMSILSEITREFGCSALNSPWKNNLHSIRILTMLTVANSHLMRKIAFEGGKPVMEKLIFVSPTLPSLYSLCFRHFVLTHFGKSQNSFAIEKVGPICQLSLSITLCGKLTSHFETRRRLCGKLTSHFETRRRLALS
jgi:hypothetical protein